MLINNIVEYCHENYTEAANCDNCINICQKNCEKCLNAINFTQEDKRNYNCNNIICFYVCKYIYRYSSEIEYLCRKIDIAKLLPEYRIVSIGCGPATELYGILNYMYNNNTLKTINYVGFDLNPIWSNINNYTGEFIKNNVQNAIALFKYNDVFKTFTVNPISWYPNILILNYVISDMVKFNYNTTEFFQNLLNNIIFHMQDYSIIIINDINHNTQARNYFATLSNLIKMYFNVYTEEAYFVNNNKSFTFQYGTQYPDNGIIKKDIPIEIDANYHPWKFCTSAQLFIQFWRR